MIMGILTAIIMALWLLPAYFKAPKEYRLDKKYIIKTILIGLVIGFIGAFILQIIFLILQSLLVRLITMPHKRLLVQIVKKRFFICHRTPIIIWVRPC